MDWIAGMREQAETAKRLAEEVTQALAAPTITADQASRLYQIVEERAQTFDHFFDEMQRDESVSATLIEAGDQLASFWSNLSAARPSKLRTLEGLPPLEPSDLD